MQITRTSIISGITRTREIDITPEEYQIYLQSSTPIQELFPHLSASDHEFIIAGTTDKE